MLQGSLHGSDLNQSLVHESDLKQQLFGVESALCNGKCTGLAEAKAEVVGFLTLGSCRLLAGFAVNNW